MFFDLFSSKKQSQEEVADQVDLQAEANSICCI